MWIMRLAIMVLAAFLVDAWTASFHAPPLLFGDSMTAM
jgi:hypothetical protein